MTIRLGTHKTIVIIFFVLFLGLGLHLVKDYGICFDEKDQRDFGLTTINYVTQADQRLLQEHDRQRGPLFEVVLIALEKGFHLTNNVRSIFVMRHLTTFLLFYLGVIFFYKLGKENFQSWQAGLLGCLFLILSPRIFADAFYNPKDIPCLSLFIICTYTLIKYLKNKTFFNTFIHAFACAVLIDIRIVGIIFPFLTLVFTFADIYILPLKNEDSKRVFLNLFSYFLFLILFTFLFWPFLWASPLHNLIWCLLEVTRISIGGCSNLYLGQKIQITNIPWHYIPVWMAITTPLVYVIAFCVGYVRTILLAGSDFIRFYRLNKSGLIFLVLFSLFMLQVILFKPNNYDGWRHYFFIYPAFLIFSVAGLRTLFDFARGLKGGVFIQIIFILLILLNLGSVVSFMIRNHPYQNVYFNNLAGRNMKEIKCRFDLDYWGLSYTKALK